MTSAESPTEAANARLREAAKWLVASAAGVGAALLAGSQLSSIGRLPVGWPTDLAHARLWLAGAGAVLGLAAVAYAIWATVQVLLPCSVLVADLAARWERPEPGYAPVVAFFRAHPKYLQGFAAPDELIAHREALVRELAELPAAPPPPPRVRWAARGRAAPTPDQVAELTARIADLDQRITAIEDMATHLWLAALFRSVLRRLLLATAVAAIGIITFAWAANPPR